MGGKIILIPTAAHECSGRPETRAYPKGTQWQCGECNQTWVLVYGSQYNEHYEAWRKLTTSNIKGEDRF
ncbi:hypothetical protein SEA_HORTUS1_15 [Microbacterium phage Hortus1]|nr:hypothetical protein SEA_HORTUS1_15 [Microbacterium phage Hortus1]AWY05589.1 hypothetical protein SEA_OLINDD_15 [Microbacterium phage OlinDD]